MSKFKKVPSTKSVEEFVSGASERVTAQDLPSPKEQKEIGTVLYLDEDIHELLKAVSKKEGRSIRQCVKRVCTAAIIGKAKLLKVY